MDKKNQRNKKKQGNKKYKRDKEKVLLFGGAGQLGQLLQTSVPDFVELTAYTSGGVDITRQEEVERIIARECPDTIINAAAYTQVDKAELEYGRAFAVNGSGPENIAAAVNGKTSIIHISTDFVFPGGKRSPYQPDDATQPLSVYGRSKLEGERNLLRLRPQQSTIIRTSWLYSAQGNNFVNTMLRLMGERPELSVVSDQIGSPTSAQTLAQVVWRFVEKKPAADIYHWADLGETSWYGFACEIQSQAISLGILKKAVPVLPVSSAEYKTAALRPAYSVLDSASTSEVLGMEAKPWAEELFQTLQQRQLMIQTL